MAAPALAQPVQTPALDRLAEKAARAGSVRVLVGVPVRTRPEGRLTAQAAVAQRAAIREAQIAAANEMTESAGGKLYALFDRIPHFVAELDANGLAKLRHSPKVSSIEEDVAVAPSLLQSTTHIGADVAWNSGRSGDGWAVAVLDTGVDKNHPFLAGKVVSEACYSTTASGSSSVCPGGVASSTAVGSGLHCSTAINGCTHGTHVAGIVAGSGAPDGSQGVAPGAGIIAMQVFSHFPAQGSVMSYSSDQIKALERVYALKDMFQIAAVNMSLGGGSYAAACDDSNAAIKAAIDNLRSVGIATVIASGNNSYRNAISAPACVSTAVSVGASCDAGPDGSACATGVGGVASYSNITPFVSLLAPGSYISSSVPGTGYQAQNGTSMAAPHVAGAWALIKHAYPSIGVTDALSLLRDNGASTSDARTSGTTTDLRRVQLDFLSGSAFKLTVSKAGAGSGSIVSAPSGIACGNDCSQSYAEGTTVTLNPSPGPYSTFDGWSGDCSGSGACTLTMNAAQSVTASFAATPFTLSVTRTGTGSGTVTSPAAGINCGSTCSGSAAGGTSVTLTAAPAVGSRFVSWSGSCTGTASSCTVSLAAARSVTASFALLSYPTTVTRSGSGSGTVISSPSGINCGSTCSATRTFGTTMTLTAVPATGSAFAGWSGACSGTGSCTVTVDGSKSVGAAFNRVSWPLSVTKSGLGSIVSTPAGINCGSVCSAQVVIGAQVTLTATPAPGYYLAAWSGSCTGSASTCVVTMTAARSATATFKQITHALTLARTGDGGGSVTSSPSGISCGAACSKAYVQGTAVKLTARPAAGSVFTGWSGACAGTASTCTVAMSQAQSVSAGFARTHWVLSTKKTGTGLGSVSSAPAAINCGTTCSALVPVDTSITLTPTAANESAFTGWSGDCAGSGACSVTMNGAKTATATFTRTHWTLTARRAGTGSGTVSAQAVGLNCGTTCSSSVPIGTSVVLSAEPALHSRFAGWSGACTGKATTCTVSMTSARTVTATFQPIVYAVTVTKSGTGAVVSSPSGISCGSTCARNFNSGSTVTLSASPATGWSFAGWEGACSGAAACSLAIDAPKAVTARFVAP